MIRLVVFITSFLFATVASYRPGDEVCVMSKDNKCPHDQLTVSKTDASTLIYPGGKTRCAFNDYTSDHYKTNATYFFQVFPKKQSKKLLLYFQGGGACTSDLSCSFATQCSLPLYTFDPSAFAVSYGVVNASNPDNIFHDWNVVHVPYCTGDVFIGKNVTKPVEPNGLFIKDECKGKNMTMHMNGYENTMSALNWAVDNYPNPEHIVVAGSSSGALGVQLMADVIANVWKVKEKKIKYGILADSFVGVIPESTTTGTFLNYFNACDVLPTSIISRCKDNSASTVEIIQAILTNTMFSDWLHVNSKADYVQRIFIPFLEFRLSAWFTIEMIASKFFQKMNAIITDEQKVSSRVSSFYVKGIKHVFLKEYEWYNTKRIDSDQTLGVFVKAWLENGTSGDMILSRQLQAF